mgnify:CR=1 FL=1
MESKAIEMNTKMESKRIEVTYKKSYVSVVLKGLTWAASILAMAVLVFLVLFILVKGIGNLTADLFAMEYNSENCSLVPAVVNTLFMTVISLAVSYTHLRAHET